MQHHMYHEQEPDMKPRSVAGIARRGNLVFVARRMRDDTAMSHRWEFPGGKVEPGETDTDALHREFLEELGASIHVIRLLGESSFHHNGGTRTLAAWLIDMDPEAVTFLREHEEAAWVPWNCLRNLHLADSDRSLLPFIEELVQDCSESP